MRRATITAFLFLVMTAMPAFAQHTSSAFARGFGGVSFLSEPGGVFGGTIGVRVTSALDLIGDVGGLTNILPRRIQADLDAAAHSMGTFFGAPVTIDGKARGVYAFGGIRATRVAGQRMKVFVETGAGVARGTSHITARAGDLDVSREVKQALRLKRADQRALLAVGGGVSVPLQDRLALDLGYRYMRIFTDDPRIDTATMTAGFTWAF